MEVQLRKIIDADLPVFFEHQLDPEANRMAAFTHVDPSDRSAFEAHWSKIRADDTVTNRTVLFHGEVAGNIARFLEDGEPQVCYWIDRKHWGNGVATAALTLFLGEVTERPLHAHVAKDNAGSLRVLAKCGFAIVGEDRGFANARGTEIEEYVLTLPA